MANYIDMSILQIVLLGNADEIIKHLCRRLEWDLPGPPESPAPTLSVEQLDLTRPRLRKRLSSRMDFEPRRVGQRCVFFQLSCTFLPLSHPLATCGCSRELKEASGSKTLRRSTVARNHGPLRGPHRAHRRARLHLHVQLPTVILTATQYV